MHDAGQDWTVQLLQPLLHNEYAYGRVCVPLCALMCVLVCELSHTPPHLCLGRLISAAHKGGLCVPRRTRAETGHLLVWKTQSHTHAKRRGLLITEPLHKRW